MRLGVVLSETEPGLGGSHTFLHEVIRSISDCMRYHQKLVFLGRRNSRLARELEQMGHEYACLPGRIATAMWTLWALVKQFLEVIQRRRLSLNLVEARAVPVNRVIVKKGVDFVWSVNPANHPFCRPYATVVWDLQHRYQPFFPEVSAGPTWNMRDAVLSLVLKRAAVVFVGTRRGKWEVCHYFGIDPDRVHVVPLPCESVSKKHLGSQRVDGLLLYPAQFWPHKNHLTLLRSIARLLQSGFDVRLVLTGSDKGTREKVEQFVREQGLEDRVDFRGFVSREELHELYQRAELMVFPSLFGPDNLPPLEAMAWGLPVVAADVPGAREQLGEAAYLADPLDEQALADAIRTVLTSKGVKNALISAGYSLVADRTPAGYVSACLEIIEDTCAPLS